MAHRSRKGGGDHPTRLCERPLLPAIDVEQVVRFADTRCPFAELESVLRAVETRFVPCSHPVVRMLSLPLQSQRLHPEL